MAEIEISGDRVRKERSPSFPFISLGKAIERARTVADAHRRSPARLITVGETWGYAAQSSGLLQTAAALKGYGLLEDIGKGQDRRAQLTDLAWRILHDTRPGAREEAIREAALRPRLMAEYAAQWLPERPSNNHCLSELHLDRGFTQAAAELFLRVFDETVAFANLKEGDKLSPSLQEAEVPVQQPESAQSAITQAAMAAPAGGDPYRLSFSKTRGVEVVGRLSTVKEIDELVRSLNALRLLFVPFEETKKPD
jgi:hypothetical protein